MAIRSFPLPFPPPPHLLRKQKEISALQSIYRICPFRTCKSSELPESLELAWPAGHSRLTQGVGSHCCTPDRPGHRSTGCSLSAPLPSFVCHLLTQSWALPAPPRPELGMAESQRGGKGLGSHSSAGHCCQQSHSSGMPGAAWTSSQCQTRVCREIKVLIPNLSLS